MESDDWNKPNEDDDSFDEKEPKNKELDNTIKIDTPTDNIGVNVANNYKNIIIKKVNKIEKLSNKDRKLSTDMIALKQFIKKPEVIKLLTLPTIRSLVSTIID